MWQFDLEFKLISGVMKLTGKEKSHEFEVLFNLFRRLCVMADIAKDIFQVEGEDLPSYICSITLRNFLEVEANLLQGAYHSAGRTLRWMLELNIAGAAACLNPGLLDVKYDGLSKLDMNEFDQLLERYDNRELIFGKFKREKILEYFQLPIEEIERLYSDLCKYCHISKISFDPLFDWPKLQYISEKFDELFSMTVNTLDIMYYLDSKIVLNYNGGTIKALKHYIKDVDGLNKYLPLTTSLIKNI